MNQALWIAKTGLDAQQTKMSVISNNLANVNTTGFKQDRAVFEDLLYQTIRQPGAQTTTDNQLPSGLMIGTGVRTVATEKLHTQGNIIQTDNALDVAIDGRGYFQILMPDGDLAYTRDGTFQINADGDVVMSNGYLLDPGINIPNDVQSVTIGVDGTVSITQPGDNEPTVIGEIELADFVNPAGLQPVGENLFKETGASGVPIVGTPTLDGLGRVIGGALETSNVNVVTELINMIETQRAYEMNSKAISTADQMLQYASQNL
ncbi:MULTISPECIES: flagellar basal-body rod protein FlgG [Methylophaga]|uniref:Flagellar basal-body rod protein FlgG n=1 Tax=Methylophaga nitratireducenticrescens TaxID=754476 RepID=I1XLD1_METNJ|nr:MULTISPECIES: flagellar basal-body rod protein FlgG [Methylophaga]AFI85200.1 flagellar basal-body rod protein FlgG [Methylophaga nitratireducenticrescens]AUZ85688.1 flagellar basal-body rod protein FlgG [Methylophaga nitratireducenticrescens]MBL1456597.1 flagellar basal-body rod protein FlgG [Methylophaga sp.]